MALSSLASDDELLKRALADLAARTGLPVAFGGYERNHSVEVSAAFGTRTSHLSGLVVRESRGLGGRALAERRPRLALDYRSSRQITHDYDQAVLGEGIATLFAVPVVVSGEARAILYTGSWARGSFGEHVAHTAMSVATDFATELRVRDEVQRQLALLPAQSVPTLPAAAREELRETFAELRGITADVNDPHIRERLAKLERRLTLLSREDHDPLDAIDVRLSPRETDVLACAALGATNADIAATLSLREGTVKSYMQAAMAKLDASTRHAAVMKARRAGLLP